MQPKTEKPEQDNVRQRKTNPQPEEGSPGTTECRRQAKGKTGCGGWGKTVTLTEIR